MMNVVVNNIEAVTQIDYTPFFKILHSTDFFVQDKIWNSYSAIVYTMFN